MGLAVALSWGIALLIGVVVLAFCGYEISWKAARLKTDLYRLNRLGADLQAVSVQLTRVQPPGGLATKN